MNVAILNTSDINGGAAVVSFRLMKALRERGINARMLVADKRSDDEYAATGSGWQLKRYKFAFYGERLRIFMNNGFSRENLFKVSTADIGMGITSHPVIKEADIVCLNWINQGMLSLADIRRLCDSGKKVFWTMHDMWCCTGICHHSYGCESYTGNCGNCKFLNSDKANDLSHKIWEKKKRLYDNCNIQFIAVSNWLAECCRKSSLLAGKDILTIPNALPIEQFGYDRSATDNGMTVVAMCAARLDDPVKGFGLLIKATEVIARKYPEEAAKIKLLLAGNIRDKALLQDLKLSYEYIGAVAPEKIYAVYNRSDVVISSSHFETLPTTLIEGLASGCLAVAFDHGGQSDIIGHKRNGYLAVYPDAEDFADGIVWAMQQKIARKSLHDDVAAKFSSDVVARKYIELFNSRF